MKLLFWLVIAFLMTQTELSAQEVYHGKASWFSTEACAYNESKRCLTANGKSLFDLEKDGIKFAAHRTFRFGKRLRVCNISNSECTEVIIEDRGPAGRLSERIVDLSKKAFEEIADLRRGLIKVTIQLIN